MEELLLTQIILGDRFRNDLGDLADLKASITKYGLWHPIVVDRAFNLIAGGRRLAAHKELGCEKIKVTFLDEVDELTKREIELEENLLRKDLHWSEANALRAEIDRLKRLKYGSSVPGSHSSEGWSQQDTANALGLTQAAVSYAVKLASAIELVPEIAQEPTQKAALKFVDRLLNAALIERELRQKRHLRADVESSIWLGDSALLLEKVATGSVDLIITDPLYGTNLDSLGHSSDRNQALSDFDDSPEGALRTLETVAREMRRVLKPNGHAYFFFGFKLWYQTMLVYERAGFTLDPIPLFWIKNSVSTVNWDVRYANSVEPFFFASSLERHLSKMRNNVFNYDVPSGPDKGHPFQKPLGLLKELIEQSSSEGDLVLDPFAGSGATLVAALQCNRRYLGVDLDPEMVNFARAWIIRELEARKASESSEPDSLPESSLDDGRLQEPNDLSDEFVELVQLAEEELE